uniref:Uncharacterized protein n=1 Tax=Meloidogyne floridensis TaxID=298350 RepID=A0A915NDK3_9BILA
MYVNKNSCLFRNKTCIQFKEVSTGHYLKFLYKADKCAARAGNWGGPINVKVPWIGWNHNSRSYARIGLYA